MSSYSDIVGLAPPPNYPPLTYGKYTEVVQIYDTALFIDPNATTTQTIVNSCSLVARLSEMPVGSSLSLFVVL